MKLMNQIACLALVITLMSCQDQKTEPALGEFMGMEATETPQLLLPHLLASPVDEYNGTFSPDGREFFYTTNTPSQGIISHTKMDPSGHWAPPKIAAFSGEYSEYDPLFSPDGKRLYFTSERPISETDTSGRTNIWYVEKTDTTWSEPIQLELDRDGVYYSSLTNNGTIYFNIWDTGDLYKGIPNGNEYEVSSLDSVLNSSNGEGDPFISPDEDYIIFRGYNNSLGQGDLYISFNMNGEWTAPENLGESINSEAHEMCPYVTADGKFFIFASGRISKEDETKSGMNLSEVTDKYKTFDNGRLNIYYTSASFISDMRATFKDKK